MTRRYVFDLDATLCTETGDGNYAAATPIRDRIDRVRDLHAAGDYVIIDTGRGAQWRELTKSQLAAWGVPYDMLRVGRKPHGHCYVDATAIPADDFFAGHADRWPDEYFADRNGTDHRRRRAFEREAMFLARNGVGASWPPYFRGTVCDVGCSTGEFLEWIDWQGPRYGMEISAHARRVAESRGISFERDILNAESFFDVVIFRGTIQHLPRPFTYLARAFSALKPGGHVALLATPNTGSLVYRMFQEFPPPVQDDARNYWMPSAKTLSNALVNTGFEVVAVEYPYLGGGYARPLYDAFAFAERLVTGKFRRSFAWPGNMMNLVARKPSPPAPPSAPMTSIRDAVAVLQSGLSVVPCEARR